MQKISCWLLFLFFFMLEGIQFKKPPKLKQGDTIVRYFPVMGANEHALRHLLLYDIDLKDSAKLVLPVLDLYTWEILDPLHRKASVLQKHYDTYLELLKTGAIHLSFEEWLNTQEPIEKVVYYTDEELAQRKLYSNKNKLIFPSFIRPQTHDEIIYILDARGNFYVDINRSIPGQDRIAHTSLSRGLPLIGAGTFVVDENDNLTEVTGINGHYWPGDLQLFETLLALEKLHVNLSNISIKMRKRCQVEEKEELFLCIQSSNAQQWFDSMKKCVQNQKNIFLCTTN